jgi:hypothetical protein
MTPGTTTSFGAAVGTGTTRSVGAAVGIDTSTSVGTAVGIPAHLHHSARPWERQSLPPPQQHQSSQVTLTRWAGLPTSASFTTTPNQEECTMPLSLFLPTFPSEQFFCFFLHPIHHYRFRMGCGGASRHGRLGPQRSFLRNASLFLTISPIYYPR